MVSSCYNVLPMDAASFRAWAQLMHRQSDTIYEDAMIAATAKIHGLTVVTRNVADFKSFDVPLFNPFKGQRKENNVGRSEASGHGPHMQSYA